MSRQSCVQSVLANTATSLDRASTALSKLEAALANINEFAASERLQWRKRGSNSFAERSGESDDLQHKVENVDLDVGQRVRVTADKDKFERDCRYCQLQISECVAHKLGEVGSVISVDAHDGTAKVDNHIGWVPIKCLTKDVPLSTNVEESQKQDTPFKHVALQRHSDDLISGEVFAKLDDSCYAGPTPAQIFQNLHERCERTIAQYMSVRTFHADYEFSTRKTPRLSLGGYAPRELSEGGKARCHTHHDGVQSCGFDVGDASLEVLDGRTPVETFSALDKGEIG